MKLGHSAMSGARAPTASYHIFERYVDSAAVMIRVSAFGEKFAGRFLELLKRVRFVVYGSPSDQVKAALAGFNPVYKQPLGGFTR
jgi:hypothetical protein